MSCYRASFAIGLLVLASFLPSQICQAAEDAASSNAKSVLKSGKTDDWRFVRTPDPGGGEDALSIMHVADGLRSDLDLAGLTILCRQGDLEIRVIVLQPLPPRSKPSVVLGGPKNEIHFEASVLPPGAAIKLPAEAASLVNGPWQTLQELSVKIEDGQTTIRGVIPMTGLGGALQTLRTNCMTQ